VAVLQRSLEGLKSFTPHDHRVVFCELPKQAQVSRAGPGEVAARADQAVAVHGGNDGNVGFGHVAPCKQMLRP